MNSTVSDNLNVMYGGSERERPADEPGRNSLKRPFGIRDERMAPADSVGENSDARRTLSMNIQVAFRVLEHLKLHRLEPKKLSEEIVAVFTDILQVDGACVYTYSPDGKLEVQASNDTWSNIYSALESAEATDGRNILIHPFGDVHMPAVLSLTEIEQASSVLPLSLGIRNYGSVISLPLVCDGKTVGAISLYSALPRFFLPERIDIFRMIAFLAASLYVNIQVRNVLEKEQGERKTLQRENQLFRAQLESLKPHTDTNAEIKAAYDELEALSFSVSHDLRGPIIAIQNNCDWLHTQHAAALNAEGQEILQQITLSSEYMAKLLDGLLAFSKAVQLDPRISLIDMTALVRTVVDDLLKSDAGASSLSVAIQPLIPAYGDPVLIRQVWYNLLSNAFKYTRYKPKREIVIESNTFNGGIKYCVSDNGVGFDMQYVDRLFGAFHRLHDAEEFEGTGVGLAIVQRIIRRHGGQVWAEGVVENGARFYFTLPRTEEQNSDNR